LHDAQAEVICRKYLDLRYQMLPYVYSSVATTHETGMPLMRALWLAYPGDERALQCDDEYLWGDGFLVAPVLEAEAKQRKVYLPAGQWWDYWTAKSIGGGGEVERDVDLETIPLYVKAGAIVPLGPVKQWTEEPVNAPLTLRVYPGADGSFAVYEDDGESFRYREGEFTRIACGWHDGERMLTLRSDPKGKSAAGRRVRVECIGRKEPVMVTLRAGATRVKL
jgi:alpha-glucosidase/alpha-D-xyloside xylohydrolase